MSKAEEAALKAYPPKFVTPKRHTKRLQSEKVDTHAPIRTIFRKAYELGRNDTIERAVSWMGKHLYGFAVDFDGFRKAMEDEK